jgi:hypothetical protein
MKLGGDIGMACVHGGLPPFAAATTGNYTGLFARDLISPSSLAASLP